MDKSGGKCERRRLRRGRIAGMMLFVCLVVACVLYYEHCCRIDNQELIARGKAKITAVKEDIVTALSHGESGNRISDASEELESVIGRKNEIYVETVLSEEPSGLELPRIGKDDADFVIVNEEGRYTLLYDTLYKQAEWVAYVLTAEDVATVNVSRSSGFVADPEVTERGYPYAVTSNYTHSGYDRGHLCPSADRRGSIEENKGTFYMSNISPQTPALNRGVWKSLEERVRYWASQFGTVYVVAGGVLYPGVDTITGGVGVPEYFYKAVLAQYDGYVDAVAFLFPNTAEVDGTFRDYAVTVDSIETITEYDFFCTLSDSVENIAESTYSVDFWFGE